MSSLDDAQLVASAGWLVAFTRLRDEGYAWWGWLTAVDVGDVGGDVAGDADGAGVEVFAQVGQVGEVGRGVATRTLRTRLAPGEALASLTPLYAGAAWSERETAEMFGVEFAGFADGSGLGLRPLLLPAGAPATPLCKAMPLAARAAVPWPGAKEGGQAGGRQVLPPGVPRHPARGAGS